MSQAHKNRVTFACGIGGAIVFCVMNVVTEGSVPGSALGGAIGGIILLIDRSVSGTGHH